MKLLAFLSEEQQIALQGVQTNDFLFEWAKNREEALEKIALYEYDGLLLEIPDLQHPIMDVLHQAVAAKRSEGLLIVSQNPSISDKINLLDAGADDFLQIPFYPEELYARIRAVIRRKRFQTGQKLYLGNVVVDFLSKQVHVWDKDLNLTKKEYELLLYFISHKGKTLSKTALAEYLWGEEVDNMDSFNLLFAHIKNLRKKLLASHSELEIKNLYGVGYQMIEL